MSEKMRCTIKKEDGWCILDCFTYVESEEGPDAIMETVFQCNIPERYSLLADLVHSSVEVAIAFGMITPIERET